jgi:uroporphyrinogen decarboxylase
MNGRERMQCVLEGRPPDRPPWVPSIYEHGAAVLGRAPGEVARDAELLARAALESYARYRHDLVTVGLDIYNVEAEALGCAVSAGEGDSIPGIVSHPLADARALDPSALAIPEPGPANRLGLLAEATARVVDEIGGDVWVYGCMGGPFSQAVELRSFENLIGDIYETPEAVHALMEKTTALALQQAGRLSARGAGIYLYESWATLPLIDPAIFAEFVVPYNQRVIAAVRAEYETPPPSVIMGGDTAILVDFFLQAGASLMAADFNTDFDLMREKTAGRDMLIRGCADPKLIERGDWAGLERTVQSLAERARHDQLRLGLRLRLPHHPARAPPPLQRPLPDRRRGQSIKAAKQVRESPVRQCKVQRKQRLAPSRPRLFNRLERSRTGS